MYIVEGGWRRAMGSESISMQSGEVEITECLREGMRAELNERSGAWCKRMTILPGTESRSSSATSKPDGRTDIPIYFQEVRETFDDHDPHAIIECKRVAGQDAALCRALRGGRDRSLHKGEVRRTTCRRVHGRVRAVRHCRRRNRRDQPLPVWPRTCRRTSESVHRSGRSMGAHQSSSPAATGCADRSAPRVLDGQGGSLTAPPYAQSLLVQTRTARPTTNGGCCFA